MLTETRNNRSNYVEVATRMDVARCGAATLRTVLLLSTLCYGGELPYCNSVGIITRRGTTVRLQDQTNPDDVH